MIKLKPCPFCGGEAYFDKDDHGWQWIECGKCHVATSQRASLMEDCKPLLAEAWNTRSAIDPEAIRRECARDARNAIFDFGIGNKASNYYSPIIRKELAVQLVERAILSTEPAQDDGKPEDESLQETLDRMDGYGIDNECGARG